MTYIELSHGIKIRTFDKAPRNFDFSTASKPDLIRYGLPTVPANPKHRERYKKILSRVVNRFEYVTPEFMLRDQKTRPSNKRLVRTIEEGDQQTNNWCGVQVTSPDDDSVKYVSTQFVVPNASSPSGPETFFSSHWIGIDGLTQNSDILQAGVECDGLAKSKSDIYLWWQWLPNPIVELTNFKIAQGDLLQLLICSDSGAGSSGGTIYFTNATNGQYTSFTVAAPPAIQLVGNCAEWISEIPTIDGVADPIYLANYGEVFFDQCEAGTVGGAVLLSDDGSSIDMVSVDGSAIVCEANQFRPGVVRSLYLGPKTD
jgi:Peptidase A4 family